MIYGTRSNSHTAGLGVRVVGTVTVDPPHVGVVVAVPGPEAKYISGSYAGQGIESAGMQGLSTCDSIGTEASQPVRLEDEEPPAADVLKVCQFARLGDSL